MRTELICQKEDRLDEPGLPRWRMPIVEQRRSEAARNRRDLPPGALHRITRALCPAGAAAQARS